MLILHDDIELTCGDEWGIVGNIKEEDGSPLSLGPEVQIGWTLLDPNGVRVAGLTENAVIERIDPIDNGQVLLVVSQNLTKTFYPGRYTNAIRVWIADAPSTLWRGMILAAADPFYSEVV